MDDKTDKTTWVVTETLPHAGDIDSTLPMNFDNGLPASVGLLLMKESTPVVDGEKTMIWASQRSPVSMMARRFR